MPSYMYGRPSERGQSDHGAAEAVVADWVVVEGSHRACRCTLPFVAAEFKAFGNRRVCDQLHFIDEPVGTVAEDRETAVRFQAILN